MASPLQVEPSPALAFSGSHSFHSPVIVPREAPLLRCPLGFVVQLSSLSRGELSNSQTSHPTPAAHTASFGPKSPQGLTRFKACLLLPSWGLKQRACVPREGRGVCSTRGSRLRKQEESPADLAEHKAIVPVGQQDPGCLRRQHYLRTQAPGRVYQVVGGGLTWQVCRPELKFWLC